MWIWSIKIKGSKGASPYEQILELRDVLNNKLHAKAKELNIDISNMSSQAICDKLKEVGGITYHQASAVTALFDLTNTASRDITQGQVNQVKSLVMNLDI